MKSDEELLNLNESFVEQYLSENGIKGIYSYADQVEENEWKNILKQFLNDTKKDIQLRKVVFRCLEFLVWIKKIYLKNIKITSRKHQKVNALNQPILVNNVFKSNLSNKDKLEIYVNIYCNMMESFKNIIEKDVLVEVLKKQNIICNKNIYLNDFLKVLNSFEKQDNILGNLFNKELRNSINHSDYEITEEKIIFYDREIKLDELTLNEIKNNILKIVVPLQFFVEFYLRLFKEGENILSEVF